MSDYFSQNSLVVNSYSKDKSWLVLNDLEFKIKSKIESLGTPLKNHEIAINYGIKTGYNDAFIIDDNLRNEFISKSAKNAEIIRPILRGRDISKYYSKHNNFYILYIPWHFPLHNDNEIKGSSETAENTFKIEYPEVYNHLLQYKNALLKRNQSETGIRYEWYALQRFGANYYMNFDKPKIIYPEITKFANFTLDQGNGYYLNNKCFMITGENLEYLTCFLNSRLFRYCYLENFPELLGGSRELRKVFFKDIKIKKVTTKENTIFKKLIDEVISLKKLNKNTSGIEENINNEIYKLYDIGIEEITAINNSVTAHL